MNVLTGFQVAHISGFIVILLFQEPLEIKVNHDGQVACMISLLTLLVDLK